MSSLQSVPKIVSMSLQTIFLSSFGAAIDYFQNHIETMTRDMDVRYARPWIDELIAELRSSNFHETLRKSNNNRMSEGDLNFHLVRVTQLADNLDLYMDRLEKQKSKTFSEL